MLTTDIEYIYTEFVKEDGKAEYIANCGLFAGVVELRKKDFVVLINPDGNDTMLLNTDVYKPMYIEIGKLNKAVMLFYNNTESAEALTRLKSLQNDVMASDKRCCVLAGDQSGKVDKIIDVSTYDGIPEDKVKIKKVSSATSVTYTPNNSRVYNKEVSNGNTVIKAGYAPVKPKIKVLERKDPPVTKEKLDELLSIIRDNEKLNSLKYALSEKPDAEEIKDTDDTKHYQVF